MKQPTNHSTLEQLVDDIVERRGTTLNVALPLGLGKPNHIINELVQRACDGAVEKLTVYTALSLTRPASTQSLEQRLMEPIVDRLYGDYPDLRYAELRRDGELPDNITVHEFYVVPGSILGSDQGQQDYLSINYTQVLRVAKEVKLDLIAQMVAPTEGGYDLSSNTDISIDLIEDLNARDDHPLVVGACDFV